MPTMETEMLIPIAFIGGMVFELLLMVAYMEMWRR